MKYNIDVWYPYGSTQENQNFSSYLSDMPKDLKTKEEVEQWLQTSWSKSSHEWFDYDELEISVGNMSISDEEWELYKNSKDDPFDVWGKAVRESRANKLSHQ